MRIYRLPVDFPKKRPALVFSLICAWTNICANTRDADDLRRHGAHYDVTVMLSQNAWNYTRHTKLPNLCSQNKIFPTRGQQCMSVTLIIIGSGKRLVTKPVIFRNETDLFSITTIFTQEIEYENVVCKMVAVSSRPCCVNNKQDISPNNLML